MTDASFTPMTAAPEAEFGDYVELLKPRVMRLVVFTAFVGLNLLQSAFTNACPAMALLRKLGLRHCVAMPATHEQ